MICQFFFYLSSLLHELWDDMTACLKLECISRKIIPRLFCFLLTMRKSQVRFLTRSHFRILSLNYSAFYSSFSVINKNTYICIYIYNCILGFDEIAFFFILILYFSFYNLFDTLKEYKSTYI